MQTQCTQPRVQDLMGADEAVKQWHNLLPHYAHPHPVMSMTFRGLTQPLMFQTAQSQRV